MSTARHPVQGHHLLKAAGRRDAAEAERALQHQADPDLPDAGPVLPIECPELGPRHRRDQTQVDPRRRASVCLCVPAVKYRRFEKKASCRF